MAWLIEAYTGEILDETPIEDFQKTNQRNYSKLKHSGKITDQDEKDLVGDSVVKRMKAGGKIGYLGAKSTNDAMKNKAVKNAIEHKYGKDSFSDRVKQAKAIKAGDEKELDKAVAKTNDIITAKDALDRHNRRHPDRAVGEGVDFIAEMMQ